MSEQDYRNVEASCIKVCEPLNASLLDYGVLVDSMVASVCELNGEEVVLVHSSAILIASEIWGEPCDE